jgi:ATP-dependent DNA helicase RecG
MVAEPTQRTSPLARSVATLWGVGPERASQLARLDIRTVEDLLLHRPRRYEDRRHFRPIVELQQDEPAITRGTVVALGVKWFKQHTRSVFELVLEDGTARLHCRWWNLPFMEKYFAVGNEVVVFGKLVSSKPRTIDHPETEVVETGEESFIHLSRITPIYPLTEGVPQRWLRALIWRTLSEYEGQGPGSRVEGRGSPAETPHSTLDGSFPTRAEAIRMLHFPEAIEDVERARRRLALDEFIGLQRQIQLRRKNLQTKARAIPCGGDNHLIKPFLARLEFKLTEAQTKVLRELRKDLSGAHPMRRLLQGDVGSGKTVVAACCSLMALESGHSVALMAPTEILAEQHFLNFTRWFGSLGVAVELRTSSHKTGSRVEGRGVTVQSPDSKTAQSLESKVQGPDSQIVQSLKSKVQSPDSAGRVEGRGANGGEGQALATLFIGTHALFTAGFELPNLGLVIIDEQHRFGVTQREQLVRKGLYPHLLVMTATPIPRTLGLTLYGDLDLSTIDQLPPGRGSIQTFVRTAASLPKVWSFVRSKLKEGRQVYVVYPRVEETGENGIKAVTKEFETLKTLLAPFRVGLVHGRLSSREKEGVMAAFRANQAQVLLATSLIEVGVDVPNATVMLIENAEQFGLAQLHQLRGRIGRGTHESYCVLVAAAKTKESRQRLKVLEETTDGFRIAEADLKLRGPGELLGHEQSGAPRFRFGDLVNDMELIERARQLAAAQLLEMKKDGRKDFNRSEQREQSF